MRHGAAPDRGGYRPVTRPERWLAVAMVAVVLAYAASTVFRPRGSYLGWADSGLYDAAYAAAMLLCLGRAVRHPSQRWGWSALAAALWVTIVGDQYYAAVIAQDPLAPWPSLADVFWLAFFPAAYAGVALLIRAAVPRFLPSMWLDGLVSAFGMAAIAYVAAFHELITLTDGALLPTLVGLAYPVGDLVLLSTVVGGAVMLGRADRMWILLALGLSVYAAADVWYAFALAGETYVDGGLPDASWPAAIALVGLAAVTAPSEQAPGIPAWWTDLLVPGALSLSGIALLVYGQWQPLPVTAVVLIAATLLGGTVRVMITWREVAHLAHTRDQAVTDELTGLLNRRGFNARLAAVFEAGADRPRLALLLLDLDGFKTVNDTHGHSVGDELLGLVGARLRSAVRDGDDLARLGGDEFAVIVHDDASGETAELVAERIARALSHPLHVGARSLPVTASVGIALCPDHATTARDLLANAEAAMYETKKHGGGHRFYAPRSATGG